MPLAQFVRRVFVNVAGKITLPVTGLPDHALQRLQRGDLAVLVHPGDQLPDDSVIVERPARPGRRFVEQAAHIRVGGMLFYEAGDVSARVGKQDVLHEGDGRGGTLDIREDGPDQLREAT